jgi:hypothetical protein
MWLWRCADLELKVGDGAQNHEIRQDRDEFELLAVTNLTA